MNTSSFKERQLLFQGGGSDKTNPPLKDKQSNPLKNKEMFEPKNKNNNSNNNKNNLQETKTIPKKNENINPILKLANQMENKIKNKIEDNPIKKKYLKMKLNLI